MKPIPRIDCGNCTFCRAPMAEARAFLATAAIMCAGALFLVWML